MNRPNLNIFDSDLTDSSKIVNLLYKDLFC